jgi:nucleoside-diphosphate-sugar epimerase
MPYSIGHNCFTTVQRCIDGKPLLTAGDGENKWTFTHSRDFAEAFVQLFGKKECIGEDYQLSGDCVETFKGANNAVGSVFLRFDSREQTDAHVAEHNKNIRVIVE